MREPNNYSSSAPKCLQDISLIKHIRRFLSGLRFRFHRFLAHFVISANPHSKFDLIVPCANKLLPNPPDPDQGWSVSTAGLPAIWRGLHRGVAAAPPCTASLRGEARSQAERIPLDGNATRGRAERRQNPAVRKRSLDAAPHPTGGLLPCKCCALAATEAPPTPSRDPSAAGRASRTAPERASAGVSAKLGRSAIVGQHLPPDRRICQLRSTCSSSAVPSVVVTSVCVV